MKETEIFEIIRGHIDNIQVKKDKPVRIAVNGIEGTGKTTFAENLNKYLTGRKYNSIHVSIDGFHFNRAHRYRQGINSGLGYYEDSYNEKAFVEKVLLMSQQDKPKYIRAVHDLESDNYIDLPSVNISHDSILITDGAYLLKPVYYQYWDLKIYLHTDFSVALQRGINRDSQQLGGLDKATDKFKNRYHFASTIYLEKVNPKNLADIIIDNTDFNNLILLKS